MDNTLLAKLLFDGLDDTPEEMEAKYPKRNLPEGAKVTRMGPSPTGFMHLGNLLAAVTSERLAHQSGGVFMLRIEDTDEKREVAGGVEAIIDAFSRFGLVFDEGATETEDRGAYGPYRQRRRVDIYHVFARELVLRGLAYPCFCTEEELSAMREKQEAEKANFGYYGAWARHRDTPLEEIQKELAAGKPYVLRLRSPGDPARRTHHKDLVKGDMDLPENEQDIVLLKSDGIPTYHFAHVVDDHLMRTTHVVRGDEWLATLPVHLQLFDLFGWQRPQYAHIAPLMKLDNGSKRKLSKRKDPELALSYYHAEGFPVRCVLEYLLTVLNSNFEQWRAENQTAEFDAFPFSCEKMSAAGALFDLDKLRDVSKNTIARMTAQDVYEQVLAWAQAYDAEFYTLLAQDAQFATEIFAIGRGGEKPRKDLAAWKEARAYMDFFYDALFSASDEYPASVNKQDVLSILENYTRLFDPTDSQPDWFEKIRSLSEQLGFAPETKLYKKNPQDYKGHVGDVSMVLRVAVTGRSQSPDMHQVMRLLGRARVLKRIEAAIGRLKKQGENANG